LVLDRPQCDDRLDPINFATLNRDNQGYYFDGLASRFQATCSAQDDISRQLGDPQEAMIRTALDFLAGRPCTPIGSSATTQGLQEVSGGAQLLSPAGPNIQQEFPSSF
jgi:hypothetical protein